MLFSDHNIDTIPIVDSFQILGLDALDHMARTNSKGQGGSKFIMQSYALHVFVCGKHEL